MGDGEGIEHAWGVCGEVLKDTSVLIRLASDGTAGLRKNSIPEEERSSESGFIRGIPTGTIPGNLANSSSVLLSVTR